MKIEIDLKQDEFYMLVNMLIAGVQRFYEGATPGTDDMREAILLTRILE